VQCPGSTRGSCTLLCHNRSHEAAVGVTKELSYAHDLCRTEEMSRLLLVEDHALFRESLALLLEWRTGLESMQAGSLAEARRILSDAKGQPVCVFVDLDVLNREGIELLKQFRGLAVVALATGRNVQRCAWVLEAGADEVLFTAESAEEIVSAVKRLVSE
jgi:two-component system, NarL family, response regulator DevR